jgi:hypothetical protein
MFQTLISRNDDLRRLVDKGYAVAFDTNHLVIRDIPYLTREGVLQWGSMVAKVEFVDEQRVRQTDHQVFFAGSVPHALDGSPIPNLGGGPAQVQLSASSADVVVERSFSNKPRKTGQFADFFEKIESYVAIVSGPAMERHGVTALTRRVVEGSGGESVFKYPDTLTSRADLGDLNSRFANDVIAVIGLGGTGAYVLDFLVKTPVHAIRAFDADHYCVHNAFRSPGRLSAETELGYSKAEVYRARYEGFRHHLTVKPIFLDESCASELDGVTFAFVCVDKGTARATIFDLLLAKQIPFIDVGMGLKRRDGALAGMLRTTYYSKEHGSRLHQMGLAELSDAPAELYRSNVQIAELNALNACLAVMRFKQLRGFYLTELPNTHLLFGIGDLRIAGDDLGENAGAGSLDDALPAPAVTDAV